MSGYDNPQQLRQTIERGVFSYIFSNGMTKVVGLANTLLVLTSLTAYAYGVAELALSVIGALSFLQLAGLERTVIADMGVEKGRGQIGKSKRIFLDFLILLTSLSICGWALLYFGSSIIGRFFSHKIQQYFVILSLYFVTAPVTTAMRILYAVCFDFVASAFFTFLQEAVKLAFLLTWLLMGGITIATVLWAPVFVQVACISFLGLRTYRHWSALAVHPSIGSFQPQKFFMHHNLWTLASNYLDSATKSIRLWLIKFFLGTEAVALFSVALGMAGQLSSFLQIGSVITPILPQYLNNRPVFYRLIDKTIKYQLILALFVILGGMAAMTLLVEILFPHYQSALPIFYILVFILIPTSITTVFQGMFYALKAQKSVFNAQVLRLILMVVVNVAMIPLLGIFAVAVEAIITTVFFALERYRSLKILYGDFTIRPKDFISYDEYDQLLIRRVTGRFLSYFKM